ncbi:MAG: VWA domain-containing protein [Myxococcota bacterium]
MHWTAWAVEHRQGDSREVHLLVSAGVSADEPRAPVMVNLLLDRSGSMKGAPLSAAVEAAAQFVELARPDDFIGLVLFDGLAEQRVPVSLMDARGKRAMMDALKGIQTGRGTALHQAVTLGLKGLQRTLVPGRRPQMLVLTDGEPSVGADTPEAFQDLGHELAKANISVHALGLAKHYVAEVLDGLTQPSGNAFEHVDGPEGLSEAMGGLCARLFGHAASEVSVRVQPQGLAAITCRHSYPTSLEKEALQATVGDVSKGLARLVLFSGTVLGDGDWDVQVHGTAKMRNDTRHTRVEVEVVSADSARGRLVLGVNHELDLVSAETSAWLSLARKDLERAEEQLEDAEAHLRAIVGLAPEGIPVRRHLERLGDLRMAMERGEGDIPLLIRRAQSARAGTNVSQIIPLQAYRHRN